MLSISSSPPISAYAERMFTPAEVFNTPAELIAPVHRGPDLVSGGPLKSLARGVQKKCLLPVQFSPASIERTKSLKRYG